MMFRIARFFTVVAALVAVVSVTNAAAQLPNPYGAPVVTETAKKVAGAALAEARKNGWTMAVAIVDPSGDLVYFEKIDGTQAASTLIAVDKARSSARFKRPTKALQDTLAAGGEGLRMLALQGAVPVDGGVPLIMDGKIVGAVGVSGGTSTQDAQCANAGAATVK
jgi:glc operon protein GlcG